VSRRPDPERIHEARREAVIRRLEGAGMIRDLAEAAVTAWEAEKGRLASSDDFDAAYRRIVGHESAEDQP
jgi:hypothetical protein